MCTGGGCSSSGGSPPWSPGTATLRALLTRALSIDVGWWFVVTFTVLGVGLVAVLVPLYFRPLSAGPLLSRHSDRDLAAAAALVRRGTPVEPADLERDSCTHARRALRVTHGNACWTTVLGASWTVGLTVGSAGPVFAALGILPIGLGLGVLAQSGLVQRRLDALDAARTPLAAGSDS